MPGHKWTPAEHVILLDPTKARSEKLKELDITEGQLDNRLRTLRKMAADPTRRVRGQDDNLTATFTTVGDEKVVHLKMVDAPDEDGAIAATVRLGKIDLEKWTIKGSTVKRYQGFFRAASFQPEVGRPHEWRREANIVTMWSVELRLAPKNGPTPEELRRQFRDELKAYAPHYPVIRRAKAIPPSDGLMHEIDMMSR